ncbi:sorbitol dehydrogenase [Enterococcus florum]|uniref:Sorbitol dehydrogenase n=1 Tax=Enterococcus florum TaxID=2480627 RepID=A0A4P5PFJ7_9ENTE|nr:zinc-binding dehydrogenase [Enterococcus florum]GCF94402.1 sorbitol dehydrogenase [Enterococcus florum]
MKALRKVASGYGNLEISNEKAVSPLEGEMKIRVLATGICGSDIHALKGEYNKQIPLTLGHEFVGEVDEIGPSVTDFSTGDRVFSETTFEVCEKCVYCQQEEFNLCSHRRGIGTQVDGSFAEYVIVKAARCHLLPPEIDTKVAAMMEPLACCIHAVMEKTTVAAGEKIAVFGPGPIGMLLAAVLVSLEVEVYLIGITKDQKRLALGKQLGIQHIIDSQKQDLDEYIQSHTDGIGVDQVFECSGSPIAVLQAMTILKKKGRLIQEGLFAKDMNEINMSLLIHKELEYIGSRTQKPSSWRKTLAWLQEKQVDLTPIVTKTLPLEHWEEAFELAMNGDELKVLMIPSMN